MGRNPRNRFRVMKGSRRIDKQRNMKGRFVNRTAAQVGVFGKSAQAVIAHDHDNRILQLFVFPQELDEFPEPSILLLKDSLATHLQFFRAAPGLAVGIGRMCNLGQERGRKVVASLDP